MSAPAAPLLEADGLALRIGERCLCRPFSLSLGAGECLVLLGPNGAGKTTLLHTLAGLRAADEGAVRLLGSAYPEHGPRDAARLRALLPQIQPDPFPASALETALIGRHPHLGRWAWEGPEDTRIAHQALARVGMADFAGRDILSLSGGERQRVAIAALLAQQPRLYLLDEPLNHLDLHYQIRVLELFRALTGEGAGVVMVLHDIDLAARYADQVILLDGRGGVAAGSAGAVLDEDRLSDAYGHRLRRAELNGRILFIPE
ncbi:MAG: ABC transporter ATP-binding protein [Rhodocyclaceae bacterium]|nr:ABC transporter ATP-binding protein [Rhodocyclaceae bacterium]